MKKFQPGHADDSGIFSIKVNNSILDSTLAGLAGCAIGSAGELSAPKGHLDASVDPNSCWRSEARR
jgi:hypothetical protein